MRILAEVAHQDVFNFDVTVHNVTRVEGLDSLANLDDYSPGKVLVEWQSLLLADVVKEVTGGHKLGHDIVAVVVLERLDELEDVWAAMALDLCHNLELLELLVVGFEGSVNFPLANDFNCDSDIRELMF